MSIDNLHSEIQRDCQPFLSLLRAGSGALFRGVGQEAPDFFMGAVVRDRSPKNMPHALHEATDRWFSQQFGVRYRGASLFCTGDPKQAAQHGRVYKIFPIGGFQFCWSPEVRDLHEWGKADDCLQLTPEQFVEAMALLDYQEEDLRKAIASKFEVMVACRRYYAAAICD